MHQNPVYAFMFNGFSNRKKRINAIIVQINLSNNDIRNCEQLKILIGFSVR